MPPSNVSERERDHHLAFEGVKGPTHLSKWLNIPDGVYLDKMHLCDIGTFKSIFNSFFDAKKKQEDYYLGQQF